MANEDRHLLIVPETQEKIKNLEKTYEKNKKSPKEIKIRALQATETALKMATGLVGLITVIDWFVPDPVLGLDEIALTALTTLLGSSITVVDNKILEVEREGHPEFKMEEVETLAKQLKDAKNKVLSSRANKKK